MPSRSRHSASAGALTLRTNPRGVVLVDYYAEDWSTLWWVRVDGHGHVIEAGADRDAAVSLLARKYDQYTIEPPPGPVVAIDVVTWRSWP